MLLGDGKSHTKRIIMYKECLKNEIFPFIIEDSNKGKYYDALNRAQKGDIEPLVEFLKKEQKFYFEKVRDLLEEK